MNDAEPIEPTPDVALAEPERSHPWDILNDPKRPYCPAPVVNSMQRQQAAQNLMDRALDGAQFTPVAQMLLKWAGNQIARSNSPYWRRIDSKFSRGHRGTSA